MKAGVETGELAGADYCGELAGHVYAVYVHDTQGAVCKLAVQGDDRDNGHGVAVADIGLDGLGAAEFNDHIEIIYTEPFSRRTSGIVRSSSTVTESTDAYLP